MIRHVHLNLDLFSACFLVRDGTSVDSDSLTQALGQHLLTFAVDELVF